MQEPAYQQMHVLDASAISILLDEDGLAAGHELEGRVDPDLGY